jgi:UDP-glucose 4-epimerase
VVHLRLAGVYGRGQYAGGSWMGKVLNRLLEASLCDQEAIVYPEWIGTNEYVYVKDVARAFAQCRQAKEQIAGVYNIGTGVLHSYIEVVDKIKEVLPLARIQIADQDTSMVPYLVRDQAYDISKAGRTFGYSPRFTLTAGLQDYVQELATFQGRYSTSS